MDFLGVNLNVRIVKDNFDGNYYDPENHTIHLLKGTAARINAKLTGRTQKWLIGHELMHAFLEEYPRAKKYLRSIFGSLSDEHYSGSAVSESLSRFFGYDETEYVSPRSTICAEEDVCEIAAFIYCNYSARGLPQRIQEKIRAVKEVIKKAK